MAVRRKDTREVREKKEDSVRTSARHRARDKEERWGKALRRGVARGTRKETGEEREHHKTEKGRKENRTSEKNG